MVIHIKGFFDIRLIVSCGEPHTVPPPTTTIQISFVYTRHFNILVATVRSFLTAVTTMMIDNIIQFGVQPFFCHVFFLPTLPFDRVFF